MNTKKNKKNIAFIVNFEKTMFFHEIEKQIADELNVFWISGKPRWTKWLLQKGVKKENICDLSFSKSDQVRLRSNDSYLKYKYELSLIERDLSISLSYIILMDRKLRNESYEFALDFLIFVFVRLKSFYRDNSIDVIFGETTHAAEALGAELASMFKVRHYHICQLTIPGNRFSFFEGFSISTPVEVTKSDGLLGRNWLIYAKDILNQNIKPATYDFFTHTPRFKFEFITKFYKHLISFNLFKKGDQTAITLLPIVWYQLRRILNYNLEKLFIKFYEADITDDYLLYFIQRQPEATIDLYAGYFANQLEVVKNISRICPLTHDLFIKLHPNGMGELSFFDLYRLSKLPRVKIIKYTEDSLSLIRKSKCIITISGTIGMEASIIGKPVLLMSDVYYKRLNGITRIIDYDMLRDKVLEVITENEEIIGVECDKELDYLYENSFEGVIGDPITTPGVLDIDNIKKVLVGIREILKIV
jgi:hypothetical protein